MRLPRFCLPVVLLGAAALVAGCTSDGDDAPSSAGESSSVEADIEIVDVDPAQYLAETGRYKFQFGADAELFGCTTVPAPPGEPVFEVNCWLPFPDGSADVTDPDRQLTGPPRYLLLAAAGNRLAPEVSSGSSDESVELGVGERLRADAVTCTRSSERALECATPIGEFRFDDGQLWLDGEEVDLANPREPAQPSDVAVGPGTNCGYVKSSGDNQGYVELLEGRVSCADAVAAIEAYDAELEDAGAQPQQVGEWLCSTDTDVFSRYRTTCERGEVTVARR